MALKEVVEEADFRIFEKSSGRYKKVASHCKRLLMGTILEYPGRDKKVARH